MGAKAPAPHDPDANEAIPDGRDPTAPPSYELSQLSAAPAIYHSHDNEDTIEQHPSAVEVKEPGVGPADLEQGYKTNIAPPRRTQQQPGCCRCLLAPVVGAIVIGTAVSFGA
jgi:hypothetical protein